MRKKATRKRPYFTMESAMTAILRDASGKMHHGILFDRRLEWRKSIELKMGQVQCKRVNGKCSGITSKKSIA